MAEEPPFDSAHIHVAWGGKLPGGEAWTCGLRMRRKTGSTTIADEATLLPGVSAALADFHTRSTSAIAQPAKLSFVKVSAIGVNGRYLSQEGPTQAIYPDISGGGASLPSFPNQIALAVTWTTGFTRGPAHKGRFYLPLPSAVVDANGLISASVANGVSESTDSLLTALNGSSAAFEVAVFSRKDGAPGNRKVTGNLVGRALDTQRRRRRSVPEQYV